MFKNLPPAKDTMYHEDSVKPPGAYLSEMIFSVGDLIQRRAYISLHVRRSNTC